MPYRFTPGVRSRRKRTHWAGIMPPRTVIDAPVDDRHLSGDMEKSGYLDTFKTGGRHGQ